MDTAQYSMLGVITAVLPVVCAVLAGAGMRRVNWLTEEADASLMRVTINLFAPCLMFDSILGNQALQKLGTVILAPAVGFGTVVAGILAGLVVARWAGVDNSAARRTFAVSAGIYNYGYIPLPLALSMFNSETVGVLFVHNVGVEVAMWSVGLLVMTGHGGREGWKKILNVPLMAIVVGLLINTSGLSAKVPAFMLQTAKLLGQCAIPLGLILIGATMADHAHEMRIDRANRLMVVSCLLRLGLLPLLFLAVGRFVPMSLELKQVVLLQAAMPAAVFPIVMARHYNGDPATALRIVLSTSVASLITIPLWIRLGMEILQLSK